jgi:beta-phosphoglucomutase
MRRIKAFIFDMDGTLVDNMRFHNQAWLTVLAEAGVSIEADHLYASTAGLQNAEILRHFLGDHLSGEAIAAYARRKEELYRAAYRPHVKAIPGAIAFLTATRRMEVPAALATSAGIENIDFIFSTLKIEDIFKAVVSGENLANGKPDPGIFLEAARSLAIDPDRCLVFEDSPLGLEAAHRAGMPAVLVATAMPVVDRKDHWDIRAVIRDYVGLDPAELIDRGH